MSRMFNLWLSSACLVLFLGACVSTGTVIQDLQFDEKMVIYQPAYWHIQTSSRPDSMSWRMTDTAVGRLYAYQPPVKLGFISISPFTVKGAVGTLYPEYTGRFLIKFHIWGRWIDEEIQIYRDVYDTDQMWESIDMERISPVRP